MSLYSRYWSRPSWHISTRFISRMSGFSAIYVTHMSIKTLRDNSKSGGFIAVTAMVALSMGAWGFALAVSDAASGYFESVTLRERRIQHEANLQSCESFRPLLAARNFFWDRPVYLSDFDCWIRP